MSFEQESGKGLKVPSIDKYPYCILNSLYLFSENDYRNGGKHNGLPVPTPTKSRGVM